MDNRKGATSKRWIELEADIHDLDQGFLISPETSNYIYYRDAGRAALGPDVVEQRVHISAVGDIIVACMVTAAIAFLIVYICYLGATALMAGYP